MSKFDLSKYETLDTAKLIIQHPSGGDLIGENDLPVAINLYGIGSKQYTNAKHKLDSSSQARSSAMLRGKTVRPEEIAQSQTEFLASVTESIENFPLTAIELYSNPKLKYITDQVDKFLAETENFMPS